MPSIIFGQGFISLLGASVIDKTTNAQRLVHRGVCAQPRPCPCPLLPAPAAIMCVARGRFVLPTAPPVWGALLAGGLLGARAAAGRRARLCFAPPSCWTRHPRSSTNPALLLTPYPTSSPPTGYLYQLALTGGLQRARAAPAVAMSYLG